MSGAVPWAWRAQQTPASLRDSQRLVSQGLLHGNRDSWGLMELGKFKGEGKGTGPEPPPTQALALVGRWGTECGTRAAWARSPPQPHPDWDQAASLVQLL